MNIVDLFTGAGGLTFGFYYKLIDNRFVKNDNCNIIFANEYNKLATATFRYNFPSVNIISKDIRDIQEEEIKNLIQNNPIDLVIGGPPCQSYSSIGARQYDDKAKLYQEYYRMLQIIQPKMFLFENVVGILSMKNTEGGLVIDDIQNKFKTVGYKIDYKILDAADYGVPQHRKRVFIIGIRSDLNISWDFNKVEKSNGVVTLEEAINDLPVLKLGENISSYNTTPKNSYQELMRGSHKALTAHFSGKHSEKIETFIKHIKQGEDISVINHKIEQGILHKDYAYKSGFKGCYGRLYANKPSVTVTTHIGTPSSMRCIHYEQDRALTPREGARIQSFPDWFRFEGSKVDVTTQIGNAVPPLLAIKLAKQIEELLVDGTSK